MDNIPINIYITFSMNSLYNEQHFWREYFNNEFFNINIYNLYNTTINNINWNTYFFDDYYYYNSNDNLLNLIQYLINYDNNISPITNEQYKENINTINDKLEECPICLESSYNYDIIKKCSHKFCNKCLSNWLLNNGSTCPICRIDLNN